MTMNISTFKNTHHNAELFKKKVIKNGNDTKSAIGLNVCEYFTVCSYCINYLAISGNQYASLIGE